MRSEGKRIVSASWHHIVAEFEAENVDLNSSKTDESFALNFILFSHFLRFVLRSLFTVLGRGRRRDCRKECFKKHIKTVI